MSWRYLRTFDHLTNISKLKNQNQQNQHNNNNNPQLSFTTSSHPLLNSTSTTSANNTATTTATATANSTTNNTASNTPRTTSTTTKNPISYYSSTIMKLLKPNSLTNITIFFAASLVAAWSMAAPLLLVDASGTGSGAGNGNGAGNGAGNEASKSSAGTGTDQTSVDSVPVDSTSSNDANSKASTSTSTDSESSSPTTSSTTTSTSTTKSSTTSPSRPNKKCPSYGCPLLPRDMYFDKEAQAALQEIRNLQQKVTTPLNNNNLSLFYNEAFINTDRSEDQATLTLIGYKGGELSEQINQDRAFVISPFYIYSGNGDMSSNGNAGNGSNGNPGSTMMRLLGVFDGHAKLGERVSEYSVRELPQLLSSKLEKILSSTTTSTTSNQNQQKSQIQNAINDTFIEIDKTAPAHESGGCTASIVLQIHSQIYVANAGDSRSFIATYHKKTKQTNIVYITREDKPDIPEERQRVENAGGEVYIPSPDRVLAGASSRVVYVDKNTGSRNGLAMSRSIGDWAAGEKGVIPNPTVEVLDMEELIRNADSGGDSNGDCQANYDIREEKKDDMNNDDQSCSSSGNGNDSSNNVEVFAVSATDGLLDFSNVEEIAKTVAMSLYVEDTPHPLSACESLITTAASSWWQAKNGRYRDDIAIAVSKLSLS
jgi:serine/threonine protein phosphatase PrpC